MVLNSSKPMIDKLETILEEMKNIIAMKDQEIKQLQLKQQV